MVFFSVVCFTWAYFCENSFPNSLIQNNCEYNPYLLSPLCSKSHRVATASLFGCFTLHYIPLFQAARRCGGCLREGVRIDTEKLDGTGLLLLYVSFGQAEEDINKLATHKHARNVFVNIIDSVMSAPEPFTEDTKRQPRNTKTQHAVQG